MKFKFIIILCSLIIAHCSLFSGPPYNTDDPEPVNFRHWEIYFSTINAFYHNLSSGEVPLLDVNYGIFPDVQLTFTIPMDYNNIHDPDLNDQKKFEYGYAYTELGIKYRFLKENDNTPQIALFPAIEIPTINNSDFSNGRMQAYLPIWMQKSWGKFTTFGGGGYWINPGTGNKNWIYAGWEAQYDINKTFSPGCEIFYESPSATSANSPYYASLAGYKSFVGINAGGFINLSDEFHFIFTVGHSLSGQSTTIAYVGIQFTK